MRSVEQDEEVARLLREYDKAIADEREAASRVVAVADELRALGVDVDLIRDGV